MIMNCYGTNALFSVILISVVFAVTTAPEDTKVTYEDLYKAGVDAYLENRWYDCIAYLEKALADQIYYRSIVIQCRDTCQKNEEIILSEGKVRISELWLFYDLIVRKALCLMKCERLYFHDRPKISKVTEKEFEKKVPYDYLQLCYFKVDDAEKAASCAYTFLIHNPGHEVMQTNLRYYMALPDIEPRNVKYLETKDYQELYLRAAHIYTEKKFDEVIEFMEKALKEYLITENECRLLCEGSMPETVDTDFIVTVANHFTFTLRCKLNCPEQLSHMYGQKHDDFFSSHYHYLQYSYYKSKKLKEACQAVASYLLLHPNDKVMIENKVFYSQQKGVQEDWFLPRKEAVAYHKRYTKELNMLKFIEESFQFDNKSQGLNNFPTPPPGSPAFLKHPNVLGPRLGRKRKKLSTGELDQWLKSEGISTTMKDKDLNGTLRVTLEGLATQDECENMIKLASDGAVHGDGYNGRESPHTEFEMFEGLTVARAATLSQRGILDPLSVQLFMNVSEKARHSVEVYFNLETELFFAYTHLVCRTALPDSPGTRKDLSHPVHADNCVLTPDGECLKQQPAYTWRDYSSIVYLNDDFEGGEFIFAKDKDTVQASIKPKCGLMVAFSAGKENLHGVKAVKKGRRCALAMWYTLDPKHKERERDFAGKVLSDLVEKRKPVRNKINKQSTTESYEESALHRLVMDDKTEVHNAYDAEDKRGYETSHQHNDL